MHVDHRIPLLAWGYFLKHPKQHANVGLDFWSRISDEMVERCESDVKLNAKVFRHLMEVPADRGWELTSFAAAVSESTFAYVLGKQERNGVGFDRERAEKLAESLIAERARLGDKLREAFPGWFAPTSGQKDASPEIQAQAGDVCYTVPKRDRTMKPTDERPWPVSYAAGGAYTKVEYVTFNPASTHHRAHALRRKYGWVPASFTDTGDAQLARA